MKATLAFALSLSFTSFVSAVPHPGDEGHKNGAPPSAPASPLRPPKCFTPEPVPKYNATTDFTNIGMVLYPAYDLIDVFGTLEALWLISMGTQKLNLYLIAATMDPVAAALSPFMNRLNSSFGPELVPDYTFDNFDKTLDILFVPGGPATLNPNTTNVERFLVKQLPTVKILATICTGATIAGRAGIFDGKVVTTNKQSFDRVKASAPNAHWVAPARYVRDGKIWSSSGVTAGIDMVYSLIKSYWGAELANNIAASIEHLPAGPLDDPFTKLNNVTGAAKLCPGYKG